MIIRRRQFCCAILFPSLVAAKTLTDDEITDQVRLKLAGDVDVNGGAIQVDVKDGVVTLRGRSRSEKAKEKSTKVASKVKGVKKVVNELVVDPNAP